MSALVARGVEVRTAPFLHATIDHVFDDRLADGLAAELAALDAWQLHRGGFFEQYERDLLRHGTELTDRLLTEDILQSVQDTVASTLMADLDDRRKVIAHRLVPGQGIAIHNDAPEGDAETYRLVVHLGDLRSDLDGGHLVLFDGRTIESINRVLRPCHNTGFAFAASRDSFHAVTEVLVGRRHSIVFSFWGRDSTAPNAEARHIAHSGGTLAEHLEGVRDLLRQWGAPAEVCLAGMLHSAYGTEHFGSRTEGGASRRERVRKVIGPAAERLVWLFSISSRASIVPAVLGGALRDHRSGVELDADEHEVHALLLIDLADTVEQLPRVPIDEEELVNEQNRFESVADRLPAEGLAALREAIELRRA